MLLTPAIYKTDKIYMLASEWSVCVLVGDWSERVLVAVNGVYMY